MSNFWREIGTAIWLAASPMCAAKSSPSSCRCRPPSTALKRRASGLPDFADQLLAKSLQRYGIVRNRPVSLRVYPERLVIATEGRIFCEDARWVDRSHHLPKRAINDRRHYLTASSASLLPHQWRTLRRAAASAPAIAGADSEASRR